jgi:hypothetical protein
MTKDISDMTAVEILRSGLLGVLLWPEIFHTILFSCFTMWVAVSIGQLDFGSGEALVLFLVFIFMDVLLFPTCGVLPILEAGWAGRAIILCELLDASQSTQRRLSKLRDIMERNREQWNASMMGLNSARVCCASVGIYIYLWIIFTVNLISQAYVNGVLSYGVSWLLVVSIWALGWIPVVYGLFILFEAGKRSVFTDVFTDAQTTRR